MSKAITKHHKYFLLFVLYTVLTPAHALKTDQQQPIQIEADRVNIDDRKGVSSYSGNVTLTQGSMQVKADKVTVYTDERRLNRVVATGNPAHFKQRPDNSKQDVSANAKSVEFDATTGLLTLKNSAELRQGLNHFQSNSIEYETRNDLVRAAKAESGDERVKVIIQPDTLSQGQ